MSHLYEPKEEVPILKLLERATEPHNIYAVGAEPMATHTWHISQVVLGPDCTSLEELERVAAQIRADLDALLAQARARISSST
jgi:hypothetical protein